MSTYKCFEKFLDIEIFRNLNANLDAKIKFLPIKILQKPPKQKKKFLKNLDVRVIQIIRSKFLSVKELLPHFQKDEFVSQFLPEVQTHNTKPPEKDFFFGLIATLRQEEPCSLPSISNRGTALKVKKQKIFKNQSVGVAIRRADTSPQSSCKI